MKSMTIAMADTVVAWLERFGLNDNGNGEEARTVDDPLLAISQRADSARRREEWTLALPQGQLALDWVSERNMVDAAPAEEMTTWSEAIARFYAGALGLAHNDTRAALGQFRLSAKMLRDLEQHRAESIACVATGMAHAGRKKWIDALRAYQDSVACIDRVTPLDSDLKELRRQIVQTVSMILDSYEQEQVLLASNSTDRTPTQSCTGEE